MSGLEKLIDSYAAICVERDALKAEVERLREALRPFARVAGTTDSDGRWAWAAKDGKFYAITTKDLLAARAALRGEEKKP
jgi:hypothetical protein